jgi:large subunit ribosomal protein LP0
MVKEDRRVWKEKYFQKFTDLLDEYPKAFIVGVDNVGSKQIQRIRMALRGKAVLLMGKNTMMKRAIELHKDSNPAIEKLVPHIVGNMGFVFTKDDLIEIRDIILEQKVAAPAKAGAYSPIDVKIAPQNTGMGPEKTAFFQALQITTKIARGTIEIINEVHLLKPGDRVGASDATLLNMLHVSPFSYGLEIQQVYDSGNMFDPKILDVTDAELIAKFQQGVTNVASASLAIGYPTVASAPHSLVNGFKNLLAIAAETEITFKEAETMKAFLADPTAFASVDTSAAPAAADEKKEAAKVEEESEEESDEDMGFGLFD